jgi:signal transduction histidine kinase
VIAMQSGVALRVLDRDRDLAEVRAALEAIRATSTEALDGLRAEVDALRHGPASGPDTPLRPRTGLADLPGLADRIRTGGLQVTVDGFDGTLPPDVDLAAYRIVQESLTNVLRHAGPGARARVRIVREAGGVLLVVHDTGTGSSAGASGEASGGHGIDGMRERAEALGGELSAGPEPGGGFTVRAWLPTVDGHAP